jgi:hypothetical protein
VMLSSDCSATGDGDVCAVVGGADIDGGSFELQPPRNAEKMIIESNRDFRISVMKEDRIFSFSSDKKIFTQQWIACLAGRP